MASLAEKYHNMFRLLLQREGSIVPFAVCAAVPCAALSCLLKYLEMSKLGGIDAVLSFSRTKGPAFGSFSTLLGFLVVFRTSQAYSRYWTGGGLMQQMTGSWFDAASSLFAFLRMSKASRDDIKRFQHLLIRLFSMMNALALTELEDDSDDGNNIERRLSRLELIDVEGIDLLTLNSIHQSAHKVELVYYWIMVAIAVATDRGILNAPPPILARVYLELGGGMVHFHDCRKLSILPFPFPYSQATLTLLLLHWVMTPPLICTWTSTPALAALFSFLVVCIFWGLYAIAEELENPFGDDPNDLDAVEVQKQMNERLTMLIEAPVADAGPRLAPGCTVDDHAENARSRQSSLIAVWDGRRRQRHTHFTNRGKSASSSSLLEVRSTVRHGAPP